MTKPIPSYTQDKSRNFGHAIVGYYSDGHKWVPVTVNQDGHLLFKQDPDTAAAITAFAASIEALVEYVHDAKEEFGDLITVATDNLNQASQYVSGIADTMLSNQTSFLTQARNDLQANFSQLSTNIQTICNTLRSNLESMFQQELITLDSYFVNKLNAIETSLNTQIAQLGNYVTLLSSSVASFNNSLSQFDTRVGDMSDSVDDLESAVTRLDDSLNNIIAMSENEISDVIDTVFSPLSNDEINGIIDAVMNGGQP